MKICVISDLHCKYQLNVEENTNTLLISNKPRIPTNQHPVAALIELIKREGLSADILLCPGDLGDKADEQGIHSAWTFLEEINRAMNSKLLLAVPGNHDVNSRKSLDKEPFAFIKSFHENFPLVDDHLKTKFWELGYCVFEWQECLFLLINTVHDHTSDVKAQKACLKPETLERIKKELSSLKLHNFKYKICAMHHHPIKHSNIRNWHDTDSLDKGDDLIAALKHSNFNIVLHGHKHQPRLVEYLSLPILAAGSFASFANLQGTGIQTMFHMIEFDENPQMGNVYSWEFDISEGWTKNLNKKFPPRVGFGCDRSVEEIALEINKIFTSNGNSPLLYEQVIDKVKEVQYLVPDKLISLGNILKTKYKIIPTPEYPLDPLKILQSIS